MNSAIPALFIAINAQRGGLGATGLLFYSSWRNSQRPWMANRLESLPVPVPRHTLRPRRLVTSAHEPAACEVAARHVADAITRAHKPCSRRVAAA